MKLKEYLENLNEIVKDNPDALTYDVIYSIDAEGNAFRSVSFEPTIGEFEDSEFTPSDSEDFDIEDNVINAICIN